MKTIRSIVEYLTPKLGNFIYFFDTDTRASKPGLFKLRRGPDRWL